MWQISLAMKREPIWRRYEAKGWIESEWGVSANNRRAKYYNLTQAGRAHLRAEKKTWTDYAAAVAKLPAPKGLAMP
jgi:DNA-binding PadR family transcriptional regulator